MRNQRGEVIIAVTLMAMLAMIVWARLTDREIRRQEGISTFRGSAEADIVKVGKEFKIKGGR
jgi:hypothetical protein